MTVRNYNFSPGPAMLPTEVLEQARDELLDWRGLGTSVMEINHHTPAYVALAEELEATVREVLAVPKDYKILFLSEPARSQFAMVPMNLLGDKQQADYLHTGLWSELAIAEAQRYCNVNVAASMEQVQGKITVPEPATWQLDPKAAYLYYAANETVDGVELLDTPQASVPLVTDMTSALFTKTLDVNRFGLIFAGAQKNFGIAALTVVIVHESLLQDVLPFTPTLYDYRVHAKAHSRHNTPATFACYMMLLMLQWIKKQGGLSAIEQTNQKKADLLYHYIDQSSFYNNFIDPAYRSRMSVPFFLAVDDLNTLFLQEAEKAGLVNLKGHRRRGGMRACIYNGMPLEGVEALVDFMQTFEQRYG